MRGRSAAVIGGSGGVMSAMSTMMMMKSQHHAHDSDDDTTTHYSAHNRSNSGSGGNGSQYSRSAGTSSSATASGGGGHGRSSHSQQAGSSSSFAGGFSVDWDEIDSIAEESLSVASSASSGHRKRKSSLRRQPPSNISQLEALENGSLTRYTTNASSSNTNIANIGIGIGSIGTTGMSRGSSSGSGSCNGNGTSKSNKHITVSSAKRKQASPSKSKRLSSKTMNNYYYSRSSIMGMMVLITALFSIYICGSFLEEISKTMLSFSTTSWNVNSITSSLVGGNSFFSTTSINVEARRALTRSIVTYYQTRKWPLTVRDEINDFELISHPANDQVMLNVPRFFLQSDAGNMMSLMMVQQKRKGVTSASSSIPLSSIPPLSRSMADMIGRTTVEGSRDFSVRTIFIGIPSYRDWHCRYTVESIFRRAKYPERLRVGVVDQVRIQKKQGGTSQQRQQEQDQDASCDVPIHSCTDQPHQALCLYRGQIDVYEMEAQLAVGPTFARHLVHRLYRGEYYALQISSHTTMTQDWDVELIEQLEETNNEMAILTTYLTDAMSINDATGKSTKESRIVICSASFQGDGVLRKLRHDKSEQPDMLPGVQGMPQLQPFFSASFAFSRGHFILTVPYDAHLPMMQQKDEEIIMALRAFSHGYDFYTPEKNVCFDSGDSESLKSFFFENEHLYKGYEKASLHRMYSILGMLPDDDGGENSGGGRIRGTSSLVSSGESEEDSFGLGLVRPLIKFYTAFGIHVREKITEHKLCNFVGVGRLHRVFQEHLRDDTMGINYDEIHFRFHELMNNHDG